jgi:glutathione S-transferase
MIVVIVGDLQQWIEDNTDGKCLNGLISKGKLVLDIINKKIIPAYFRAVQAQEPDKQTAGREEFIAALKEFAEKLPKNDGPFYGGKTFGFVDIELTPWILRLVTETMELIGVDCISWKSIAS